jgi:uncharacterized membrane protein YphA (DoxX/SURF4 family)
MRRLFLLGLGGIYLTAFVSLWVQIDGLIGSEGILPARDFLAALQRETDRSRFVRLPTLAWITGATDGTLHALCAAGVLASALLATGIAPAFMSLVSWLTYLSLYHVSREFLSFQWDILLLEAGFLAIFYSPLLAWSPSSLGWSTAPSRVVIWLLRLLVFKIMLLSGLVKLSGGDPTWRSLTALTFHYETTCLPTWTGWYMHQLPAWLHVASAIVTFSIELVIPFLIVGPRRCRLAAAAAFVLLMSFIAATGNYGFFNPLIVVLCLPLLDDGLIPKAWRASRAFRSRTSGMAEAPPRGAWPGAPIIAVAGLILVLTPIPFAHSLRLRVEWPRPLARLHQLVTPFHFVNGYGLFARMTTERREIMIEGSEDGREWRAYEFRWKPGDPRRRPQFVQPHMPRLDWLMWFAALSNHQSHPWFIAFCRRLLQGSAPVVGLLDHNPFPDRPPRYLRTTVYDYEFSDRKQRRERGTWWRRREVRPYTPVLLLAGDGSGGLQALPDNRRR